MPVTIEHMRLMITWNIFGGRGSMMMVLIAIKLIGWMIFGQPFFGEDR